MRLGAVAAGASCARRRSTPIEQICHLASHAVGCHPESLVDMDIALGDPPSRVSKQRSDRQFGKSEISGQAGERMAQRVGCDVGQFTVLNAVLIRFLERCRNDKLLILMARPKGFEPLTPKFVVFLFTRTIGDDSADLRVVGKGGSAPPLPIRKNHLKTIYYKDSHRRYYYEAATTLLAMA